jgi:hypothetical protein
MIVFVFVILSALFQNLPVLAADRSGDAGSFVCYEWMKSTGNFTSREVIPPTPLFNRTRGLLPGEYGGLHVLPNVTIPPPVLSAAQKSGKTFLNDDWTYTSTEGQDKFVIQLLQGKRGGYFVDVGARYWNRGSNSFSLEYYYDWKGLCVEPDEKFFTGLTINRTCTVICNNPIDAHSGHSVFFNYEINGHHRKDTVGTDKHTVTLREIFNRFELPSVMDYLSLDIEGYEYNALLTVDLNQYTFLIISVERPGQNLHKKLVYHGYYWLTQLKGDFGEMIYIHRSIPDFTNVMNTYRPYASTRYRKANYPYFNDPTWPPGSAVKQQSIVKPLVKAEEGEGEKLPPNPWLPASNSRPPPPKLLQTLMGGVKAAPPTPSGPATLISVMKPSYTVKQPPTPTAGQFNVPLTASGQYKGRPLTSVGQPKLPPNMAEALKLPPPAPWDGPPKVPLTQMSWQQQQLQLQQQQQQLLQQQQQQQLLQQQQQQQSLQQQPLKWPPPTKSKKQTKWSQPKWPPPVDAQKALSDG